MKVTDEVRRDKFLYLIIIIAVILVWSVVQGKNMVEPKKEDLVIYFPEIADLPNTEQGTVVFEFNFPDIGFKVGNKSADVLMFLDSKTIPGLQLGYNVEDQKVRAGLPMIISEEITLIDGKPHKLAYAFNKEQRKQWIYFDGQPIAEGEYTGDYFAGTISGFAIHDSNDWIESPIEIRSESTDSSSGVII